MAYAFVQSTRNAADAGSTSIAQAFASNVSSNNLLLAAIGFDTSGSTGVSTITDTLGNVWNRAIRNGPSANANELEIWWALAKAGGANTVTAKWSTGTSILSRRLAICEYSGNSTTSPVDQTNANSTSGSSTPATGAITPSADNELIFGAIYNDVGGTQSIAAAGGFTSRALDPSTTGAAGRMQVQDLIQGTANSTVSKWTVASGADPFIQSVVAFKVAAAGGGSAVAFRDQLPLLGCV